MKRGYIILLILLLNGCATPRDTSFLYPSCSIKMSPNNLQRLCGLDTGSPGFWYDARSNNCVYKHERCVNAPFSTEDACKQSCIFDQPRWTLLSDKDFDYLYTFFKRWEVANLENEQLLIRGIPVVDYTNPYSVKTIKKIFEESSCDVKQIYQYLENLGIGPRKGYLLSWEQHNMSLSQLQDDFQCLGTLSIISRL
ncbi:hypothetical protein HYS50_00130 [Candidatus Woesearchaeota archaeon]|nr:hypothetical protein [Candidatus Woesearchaeota archaeon]